MRNWKQGVVITAVAVGALLSAGCHPAWNTVISLASGFGIASQIRNVDTDVTCYRNGEEIDCSEVSG